MSAKDGVYNLTALADRLPRDGVGNMLPVLEHDVLAAAILRPKRGEPLEDGSASYDTIYVIIAGYCRLRSGRVDDVEATAGDVLFVPKGQEPRFAKLSRKFEMWKLVLRPPAT